MTQVEYLTKPRNSADQAVCSLRRNVTAATTAIKRKLANIFIFIESASAAYRPYHPRAFYSIFVSIPF